MTTEQLDKANITPLTDYDDCIYNEDWEKLGLGRCYKKLRIYYVVRKRKGDVYIDRLCKKHVNVGLEKDYEQIIELSIKDITYLKIIGKI